MGALPSPIERLAILVWAAEPESPQRCATPFHFAAAAAALDAEVEMYFTARSVRLLLPTVAAGLYPATGDGALPLTHFIEQAVEAGVRFFACPTALAAHCAAGEALRADVRHAGAASFLGRTLDPAWRSLSF
jgi:uncharacterized protein